MKLGARAGMSGLVVAAVAALASPALGANYTLNLSAPPDATVGQPLVIQASGVQPPPAEWWSLAWLEVVAIPSSVMPQCPAAALDGGQVAAGTGGRILAIALRPNLDQAGNFSNVVGYTPTAPGAMLICGYTDDGAGATLATATMTLNVKGAERPANVAAPRVKRSAARLVCDPGRWSGNAGGYAYGWLVNGKQRAGATGSSLRVKRALRGRKVQCSVTASNAAGSTTAVSRALRVR